MTLLQLPSPVLVFLLPIALASCGEKAPSDPRAGIPLVRVATVQQATHKSRSFTGIIAARVQSALGFRVSGKVLERLVDTGQSVTKGQPLMRIDPVDLRLAAHAQEEAVAAARARAEQTADDEVRYRRLLQKNAVSVSSYDQVKAAADSAKALLSAAEAQAKVALNATEYAELAADADGVVVETRAEPGQVVSSGQAVVSLAHAGDREAVIQLPETLRPALGTEAQATLFGRGNIKVPARLRQLSNAADQLTRTFEARYVLEGELAAAPLGATVMIQMREEESTVQGGLQIPLGAMFDPGKGPGVWVIGSGPAHVTWREIKIEGMSGGTARIAGPLQAGDRIVALGAHLLREGEPVRLEDTLTVSMTEGGIR